MKRTGILAVLLVVLALAQGQAPHPKSYQPGAYGKRKDAPMFVCWREWDGEIRLGGVAKSLSTVWSLPDDFAIEIQGPSGCANHERLLFGHGATNIWVSTNWTGTIQIGNKFFRVDQLQQQKTP